jgi:hypothetical protein
VGELLEIAKFLASHFVLKLHGKGVQAQQSPKRFDILTGIFEEPQQRVEVTSLRVVNSLQSRPGFAGLSAAC